MFVMLNQPKHSDFIKSIMETKEDLLAGYSLIEQDIILKDYHPFLINKHLAKHVEYIFLVNIMNMRMKNEVYNSHTGMVHSVPTIGKKQHYHFLLHSTPIKTGHHL